MLSLNVQLEAKMATAKVNAETEGLAKNDESLNQSQVSPATSRDDATKDKATYFPEEATNFIILEKLEKLEKKMEIIFDFSDITDIMNNINKNVAKFSIQFQANVDDVSPLMQSSQLTHLWKRITVAHEKICRISEVAKKNLKLISQIRKEATIGASGEANI